MDNRLATTDMGRKLGCARAEAYHRTKWHLDPSSRLAQQILSIQPFGRNTRAENWGLCPLYGEGELDSHLAQCGMGRGLPPYQVAS